MPLFLAQNICHFLLIVLGGAGDREANRGPDSEDNVRPARISLSLSVDRIDTLETVSRDGLTAFCKGISRNCPLGFFSALLPSLIATAVASDSLGL